ncbi:ComEC/Rec2 family competence protein [Pedobacter psychroterrae]|uniref:ComEC family competence protein n=1 Tax=Pedobacter psychroterrae TaxID=2530453 RepID=A0A4V6N5Y4_9SPHI|nr:ComEC/Rec2 family competence protein [Pedobacter psychroterrae]TCC98176.1 ComEC family competence protein [Pedobacter psychroterrae]
MKTSTASGTFVRILLPFAGGILLFYEQTLWNNQALITWNAAICIIMFIYLFIANLLYKRLRLYRFKGFNGLAWSVFIFFFGALWVILHNESLAEDHYANKPHQFLKIKVNDEPRLKNNILRFKAMVNVCYDHLEDDGNKASGSLMVSIATDSSNRLSLSYGDELIIPYKISTIKLPKQTSDFDYKAWLAAQNIYHQTFLRQADLIKLPGNNGHPIISFALNLRKKQVDFYRQIMKDDEAFAVAATLILGYRTDLDKETLDIYSKTGTIHALSVSGMHVGLVYLVLNWMLQFMNRRGWLSMVKLVLILISVWFYALLTGFSPSVLRSVIMLSVFIIAKSFARKTSNYNIMAFAACCLLLYDPFLIWDIGFQLSFLAVAGLIWLQPMIQNWWHIEQDWLYKIWGTVAMSLAAQLATCPFSLYYFHQFPVYFLISNLFILIPIAVLMYMGIIILLFRIEILGPAFEWLISFTNKGLTWIATLPFSSVSGIFISKTQLVVLCVTLLLFVFALSEYKKRLLFASLIGLLIFQLL